MEKEFNVLSFNTSRELKDFVRKEHLTKEDIVAITEHPTPFTLYYFK